MSSKAGGWSPRAHPSKSRRQNGGRRFRKPRWYHRCVPLRTKEQMEWPWEQGWMCGKRVTYKEEESSPVDRQEFIRQ